ncbi:carbon-nitrogen hydrolase family protein [Burkholderia sp. Bp8963]|uniref:carbon-nitrogen hydrolase family protein n=1 Tax=Burkholderia sp. Bp8963 TaxID=2184547 RepID=UPI000F5978E4|nr:carbon-nitrogen hydrolase family protein [Burkholderia sp. Bp8963]RQS56680.1 carbon-nitrogen hydrolase family protein [Burkholderia sp. Bp8963]
MSTFTIAAAQATSKAADIEANVARHLTFLQTAAEHDVKILIFPELSLTGYERQLGRQLAMTQDDPRLLPLVAEAQRLGITAVVGAPVMQEGRSDVFIGAFVLGANGEISVHTKQHLHPGEDLMFSAGSGGPNLVIDGNSIALAICADFSHSSHASSAADSEAHVYAASALITENGYPHDTGLLAGYAAEHEFAVLMANHGGATGGWETAGRSAIWSEDGELVIAAPGPGDMLVTGTKGANGWTGAVIAIGDK